MKPAIGDFVDRFKITGEIGSGGMGYVFSAVDPELQRLVAVKILQLSGSDSADQIERFKREG
ncbi:MAG: serine/threonine protein kinase, partial [Candidatus Obscuribacterales bacterium]|nr:serine/threonine protein kinase [Candidatus Obscuribacterales bacterium]